MIAMPSAKTIIDNFLDEIASYPEFGGLPRPGVNSVGGFGNTPLKIASVQGNTTVIGALLDSGADINAINEDGYTALHHAISQGHTAAAMLLIERGANVSIKDRFGNLPIDYAESPELRALFK